ncbi:MAG: DUF4384 domain-containing protein [Polyangia bacterium]
MKFACSHKGLVSTLSALSCFALLACTTPQKKPDEVPPGGATTVQAPPTTPPPAVSDKPVELTLKMDAITAKEGNIELKPGGTLKSGDRMAISFSVDQPAYVYIAMAPATGAPTILYPKSGDELVKPGQTVRFPSNAEKWIKMDESTGVENFFVYASKTPLPSSDLINMVNADAATAKKRAAARAATSGKSSGKSKSGSAAPVLTADSRGVEVEGEEPETQPTSVAGSPGVVRKSFSVNHR